MNQKILTICTLRVVQYEKLFKKSMIGQKVKECVKLFCVKYSVIDKKNYQIAKQK